MAALTLDPDEIVIGGEIVHVAPVIVEQAAATLRYELHPLPTDEPVVVRAGRLRDTDGALGALAAAFHLSPLLVGYPQPETADGREDLRGTLRTPIPAPLHARLRRAL
jgi:hypothetical protein